MSGSDLDQKPTWRVAATKLPKINAAYTKLVRGPLGVSALEGRGYDNYLQLAGKLFWDTLAVGAFAIQVSI
jgi:hypothetical protein